MAPNRLQFTVNFTSASKSTRIEIPPNLNLVGARFIVSGVAGAMQTGTSIVNIHSPMLMSNQVFNDFDKGNDLIATSVLGVTPTKPTNRTTDISTIGFYWPEQLNYSPNVEFFLKDYLGQPLNDIDYLILTIDVYTP